MGGQSAVGRHFDSEYHGRLFDVPFDDAQECEPDARGDKDLFSGNLTVRLTCFFQQLMDSLVDAHLWLLKRLPPLLLASYLNLLRFINMAGSGVANLMTHPKEENDKEVEEANRLTREFITTKVADPMGKSVKDNLERIERRVNASVIFVMPRITTQNYHPIKRAHESIR